MAKGDPPTSPWTFYDSGPDANGKKITATVTFGVNNVLTGGTVHRDAGCLYTRVLIGVGSDGSPDSSTRVINVSNLSGDRAFTAGQLAAVGLSTVSDILTAPQITVGF